MAVLVEIGCRDTARGLQLALSSPNLDKRAVAPVAKNGVGFIAVLGFEAADVEVEEAVAVEIAPGRPDADAHGPRRKRHVREFAALEVAIELAAFPAEQIEVAVVVVVTPDCRP